MISAFGKALDQMVEPAFRRVLIQALALTILAYLAVGIGAWYGIDALPRFGMPWLDAMIHVLSGIGLALAMAFLFPAAAGLFISFFLDDVAAAVEGRYYPADRPGRPLPVAPALVEALWFGLLVVVTNLLVLPLYLLMLWFPPVNLVIFYTLNGYLLGREYFELVAWRHLDRHAAAALRKAYRGRIFLAGLVIAGLFSLPLVSLLAPLAATAAMVHIFKGLEVKA